MTNQANEKERLHLEMELLPAFDVISVIHEALRRAPATYGSAQAGSPAGQGPTTPEELIELIGEDEVRRLVEKVIPPEPSAPWEQKVFAYVEELATSFLQEMDPAKADLLRQALGDPGPAKEEKPWNTAQRLVAAVRRTESRNDRDRLEEQATDTIFTRNHSTQENGMAHRYPDGSMAFQPQGQKPPSDITNTKAGAHTAMQVAKDGVLTRAAAHAEGVNEAAWGYRLRYYTPRCGHADPDQHHYREHLDAARQAADAAIEDWELYGEKTEILRFEDHSVMAVVDLGGLTPDCWEITDDLALHEALEDLGMAEARQASQDGQTAEGDETQ